MVRHPLAQKLLRRVAVGPGALVPAAPADPLALGNTLREGGHPLDRFALGADADEIDLALRLSQTHDVGVRVDEAGQDGSPAEIDQPRLLSTVRPRVPSGPHEDDAIAPNRDRLGVGPRAGGRARCVRRGRAVGRGVVPGEGVDTAVHEQELGRGRLRDGGCRRRPEAGGPEESADEERDPGFHRVHAAFSFAEEGDSIPAAERAGG
jgi:hypothetical protein